MPVDRCQDLLNRCSQENRTTDEPQTQPASLGGTLEWRLSQDVARLRSNEAALLAYLSGLPSVQRFTARVVAIRQLGSARGAALCRGAFGPGQALFPNEREAQAPAHDEVTRRMEQAFGLSFQDVRLRTDAEAASRAESLGARAYTDGREIGFARGVFDPGSRDGLRTIAHEFAHVAQRRGGTGGARGDRAELGALGVPDVSLDSIDRGAKSGDALEADADAAAEDVLAGRRPAVAEGEFDWAFSKPGGSSLVPPGQITVHMVDHGVNFYINPADAAQWRDFNHAWGEYFRRIWPSATPAIADECRTGTGAGWVKQPPSDDKLPKDRNLVVRVTAQFHQFAADWMARRYPHIKPVLPPVLQPGGGSYQGKPGDQPAYPIERFEPFAELVIEPDLPAGKQGYVKGATVKARVSFERGTPCSILNYFPRKADFDWTVWKGEKVHDKGPLLEGSGVIEYALALNEVAAFQFTVQVTSRHFTRELPPLRSRLIQVVSQEERAHQDRNALLVSKPGESSMEQMLKPFMLDENGELHLKPGQTATTSLDEQIAAVKIMRARILSSFKDGKITEAQRDKYLEYLQKLEADYTTERKRVENGSAYAVRGVFTNREDSTTIPLVATLREISRASSDSALTVSLELVDLTLDPSNRGVFSGSGTGDPSKYPDARFALDDAGRAALTQIAANFKAHNEYPDGLITLISQLPSGWIDERSFDTYHPKKTVKKVATGVAFAAGVVGIGAGAIATAPATGGTSLGVGAKAVAAYAVAVGLIVGVPLSIDAINEHMNYRRGSGADRQIALNMLALVSMGLGGGTFTTAFKSLGTVGQSMILGSMVVSDIAQGVLIRQDYLRKLTELETLYSAELSDPNLTPSRRAELKRRFDEQAAALLADAAGQSAFLLVSIATTGHGFVQAQLRGGRTVNVRKEYSEIAKSKDWKAARARLQEKALKTNEEILLLEETFEQHAPAQEKQPPTSEQAGGGGGAKGKEMTHEPVPGLYDGVKVDPKQGNWEFATDQPSVQRHGDLETIDVTTWITLTTPEQVYRGGFVQRRIRRNLKTGQVELLMDMAFLDEIPGKLRWVNEGGAVLREGQGTPLQTYVTLMQMKIAGVRFGQLSSAKMSTIINKRTCLEMGALLKKKGGTLTTEDILSTQSGNYGRTNIEQSGSKVTKAELKGGGKKLASELAPGTPYEDPSALKGLGLEPGDEVPSAFDIIFTVERASTAGGTSPPPSGP